MKEFFGIEKNYEFEVFDLTAVITLLNVALIVLGFWWAPVFGLMNCAIFTGLNLKNHGHVNAWLTQVALVVLNVYFLI